MLALADMRNNAITGMTMPQTAEALIASRWPGVAAYKGPAALSAAMQQLAHGIFMATIKLPLWASIFLTVPVTVLCLFIGLTAWALVGPFFFLKVLPGFGRRYVVTNQRVAIQHDKGLARLRNKQEVKLTEMASVRVVAGSEQPFYDAADLEILDANGKRLLMMTGVGEYATFRRAIEDAWKAWARPMPKEQTIPATSVK